MTMEYSTELLVELIDTWEIPPTRVFTAAAGPMYGLVETWELPNRYTLIRHGTDTEFGYDTVLTHLAQGLPLAHWLGSEGTLRDLEDIQHWANMFGPEAVPPALLGDEGPFYLLLSATDGEWVASILAPDESGPRPYDTFEAATAAAAQWEGSSLFQVRVVGAPA
jgi:hypothetical protein